MIQAQNSQNQAARVPKQPNVASAAQRANNLQPANPPPNQPPIAQPRSFGIARNVPPQRNPDGRLQYTSNILNAVSSIFRGAIPLQQPNQGLQNRQRNQGPESQLQRHVQPPAEDFVQEIPDSQIRSPVVVRQSVQNLSSLIYSRSSQPLAQSKRGQKRPRICFSEQVSEERGQNNFSQPKPAIQSAIPQISASVRAREERIPSAPKQATFNQTCLSGRAVLTFCEANKNSRITLKDEYIKRLTLNYAFFLPNPQKQRQYEELSKSKKVLGLEHFETLDHDHQVARVLFVGIIDHLSAKLRMNPIAAIEILKIHLKLNEDKYLQTAVLDLNRQKKILKAKFFKNNYLLDSEGKINIYSEVMQTIVKQLTGIYIQECSILLKIFNYITKYKNVTVPPNFFKDSAENVAVAMEFRLAECKKSSSTGQRKTIRNEELTMCVELLLTIAKQERRSISPKIVGYYLNSLETIIQISRGFQDQILELINILLKLDKVYGALRGNQADQKQLVDIYQIPGLLDQIRTSNIQPLVAIYPSIEAAKRNSRPPEPSSLKINFQMSGAYWKDWLNIWSIGRKFKESWQIEIEGKLAIGILQVYYDDFWKRFTTDRENLDMHRFIQFCFTNDYTTLVFVLLTKLLGKKSHSYVEETIKHFNELCGVKDSSESALLILYRSYLMDRVRLEESFISFFGKMIELQPNINNKLQPFLRIQAGEVLTESLVSSFKTVNSCTQVFKALNSIILNNATIEQFNDLIRNIDLFQSLATIQADVQSSSYHELLDTLTQHIEILLERYSASQNISGHLDQWLQGAMYFLIHPINIQRNIKIVDILLKYFRSTSKFAFRALNQIYFESVFKYTLQSARSNTELKGVKYENKVVKDFCNHPASNTFKIKHLVTSLKILLKCLKLLRNSKGGLVSQKDKIPLLEGIRSKFLLDVISLKSEILDSWAGDSPNVLIILMSFILLQDIKAQQIQKATGQNIVQLGLQILNALMLLSIDQKVELNKIDKIMESERVQRQYSLKNEFINYLKRSVTSEDSNLLESILQMLISMVNCEKVLLAAIAQEIKGELALLYRNIFKSEGLQNLRLANLAIFFAQISLNKKILGAAFMAFLNLDLIDNIILSVFVHRNNLRLNMSQNQTNRKDLETQMSFSLISNTCELLLLLLAERHEPTEKSFTKNFFFIFSPAISKLLFQEVPNFNIELMRNQKGIWINQKTIKTIQLQMIHTNKYSMVLKLNINSVAQCNWCRLYMLVVNEDIEKFRQMKEHIREYEQQLQALLDSLIQKLQSNQVDYTQQLFFFIGMTIKMVLKRQFAERLCINTTWMTVPGSRGPWLNTMGRVYVLESICSVMGEVNRNLLEIIQNSINMDADLSIELLVNLLGFQFNDEIFASVIAVQAFSESYRKNHLKSFVICSHFIISALDKHDRLDIDLFMSKLNPIIYSIDLANLQLYLGSYRNQEHIYWCWILVLLRELFVQLRNSNDVESFFKYIILRIKNILTGDFKDFWDAPAIVDEVYYLLSALCSSDYSLQILVAIEPNLIVSMSQGIAKICQRDSYRCYSGYEQLLALRELKTIHPGSANDLDKKQTNLLQATCQLTNLETALCYCSLLAGALNQSKDYLNQLPVKEIKQFERNLLGLHLWLVDVYAKYTEGRSGEAAQDEAVEQTINQYNSEFMKQNVSLELGYLNTLREIYNREIIAETAEKALECLQSSIKLHLRNMIGCHQQLKKELSPAGFSELILTNLSRARSESLGVSIREFDQFIGDIRNIRLSTRL